jgi:hypothetical protein
LRPLPDAGIVTRTPQLEEAAMTDVASVIDTYIASWNEADAERRRRLVA